MKLLVLVSLVLYACQSTVYFAEEGYEEQFSWIDDDTYRVVSLGQWDRDKYYWEEGETSEIRKEKIGQSSNDLLFLSETASLINALNLFKKKNLEQAEEQYSQENQLILQSYFSAIFKHHPMVVSVKNKKIDSALDMLITYEIKGDDLKNKIFKIDPNFFSNRLPSKLSNATNTMISNQVQRIDELNDQMIETWGGSDDQNSKE